MGGKTAVVVGNAGGAPSRVHMASAAASLPRIDLRDGDGTPLEASAGRDVTDVAISPLSLDGVQLDVAQPLDGVADIVLGVEGDHNLVYPGGAVMTFSGVQPQQIGVPATDGSGAADPIHDTGMVALLDVDGDGDTDIVFGNQDGSATTYYNDQEQEPTLLTLIGGASPPAASPRRCRRRRRRRRRPRRRCRPHPAQPPLNPCIGQGVSFAFDGTEILFSNLGGAGPDTPVGAFAGRESIRYVNVGSASMPDGTPFNLDLELTAESAYTPHDASLNVLNGKFAQVNLACNEQVDLKTTIVFSCSTGPSCLAKCAPLPDAQRADCYASGCACFGTTVTREEDCTSDSRDAAIAGYDCPGRTPR